jgi:hypothetical protein
MPKSFSFIFGKLGLIAVRMLSDGFGGAGGGVSGSVAAGLDTVIKWLHDLHFTLAVSPLILEASTRYFFPHSSQMIIMVDLLIENNQFLFLHLSRLTAPFPGIYSLVGFYSESIL